MTNCIENIPRFIKQWGNQLKHYPDYAKYFENSLIGNFFMFVSSG